MQRISNFLDKYLTPKNGIIIGLVGRSLRYFRWEERQGNLLDFYRFLLGYNSPTYFEDSMLLIQICLSVQTTIIVTQYYYTQNSIHQKTEILLEEILEELKKE
jgi:hypothetical protein